MAGGERGWAEAEKVGPVEREDPASSRARRADPAGGERGADLAGRVNV